MTNGAAITRADFQRWAHEDRNHMQADMTRTEREERRKFKKEQKELYRSRGEALKQQQHEQLQLAKTQVESHRQSNLAVGSGIKEEEKAMSKRRTEQQDKWREHGFELTQQYTIKAAQNNMRSLKAQNAGIVNSMHAKKKDRESIVESQRGAAADERRQRVERVRAETNDTVTRNAKKAYVDERWDLADTLREQGEMLRAQRKAQELAYLESALAINAATSMEPAKKSREDSRNAKQLSSHLYRDRKKQLKEQSNADGASLGQAKSAIHDTVHSLKFVPSEEVKSLAKADSKRFSKYFDPRMVGARKSPSAVKL